MAQAHGDRLTATDASFLAQEGPSSHMHVGAVMIFEGPPPLYTDFVNQIRSRLHLVPRYRQKLAFPPIETGRPVWIDDPSFNLEYHVRHTALPAPGSEEQLRALAARIHSQRLDRAKPPSARPSTTHSSQSGFERSSCWEKILAANTRSCCSEPGSGSEV